LELAVIIAPIPPNEVLRLQALLDLAIMDTDPEPAFDAIAQAAAAATGAPIALISLAGR
jgi:hypothetical protein